MSVPKIVTGVLSDQARFSVDLKGDYYFVGGGNAGGYGILIKEEYKDVVPLKFLVALLNSSLLDWRLKQLSTEFEGGFYSYARRFIKDLPIKLPSTDEEKALAEEIEITVDEIIDLLKKHYEVKALWEEWSGKLGKRKLTLKKLIETWERGVGRLPQERLFFTNIRTLSDEETEYDGFELEMRDGTLRLLGREGDILMPVLELEGEEELLEHVYFSVLSLLESKRKVKTLGDILSKTEVPTIDGDPLETKRIILKIKEDANVKHLTSFMKLMKEKEIYLDALVFKLYGLSKEEARLVLESLGKNQEYIEKVLDHL